MADATGLLLINMLNELSSQIVDTVMLAGIEAYNRASSFILMLTSPRKTMYLEQKPSIKQIQLTAGENKTKNIEKLDDFTEKRRLIGEKLRKIGVI